MTAPLLLPYPRQLTLTGGTFTLPAHGYILTPAAHFFSAQQLQAALPDWQIAAAMQIAAPSIVLQAATLPHPEGYRLTIRASAPAIVIEGAAAGLFYGVQTLIQLLRLYGTALPCLHIEDQPDFAARGVMLDISRDKVPTLATLKHLVARLAHLKINQVQLYMEHTFAYSAHREVWEHATPITPAEILELDVFCRERFVELVPNQNSLGHMERWLKFPRYNDFAECPDGFIPPWGGDQRSASTLDPQDPRSLALITSLYDELLPHFSSRQLNVGGDEPWELGKGKSQAAVEARGGRVYLDFILQLHAAAQARGRQMQFWGDIIMHYPELIPELPRDALALEWGYEANHPFADHSAKFAQAGIPFYVCPGTSSWNTLVGRTANALGNIRLAAEQGLKNGAVGLLNTDWGDNGHWQPLTVSFLGLAYGAAVAWGLAANQDLDIAAALDAFVFDDSAQVMGKLVYELGNVYQMVGPDHINGQIMAYALQWSQARMPNWLERYEAWGKGKANLAPQTLEAAIARVDELSMLLAQAKIHAADAEIILAELTQAARLLQHGAKWLLLAHGAGEQTPAALKAELQALVETQQQVWLMRNRVGGLADSVRRFDLLLGEYDRLAN
jgi:hypothetical protein